MHPITKKIKLKTVDQSLDDLGQILGYEKTYLSSLINGKGNFPFSFMAKLSIKLNMDLDELQRLKDENTK